MDEYKVKQIWPAHADHICYYNDRFLQPMFKNEPVVAQPKYDGERMLVHFNKGEYYCTSRRHSKKTDRYMENQDKLPVLELIADDLADLDYTVIDCECYAKDWSTIVGILHSLPERAIELQEKDKARFAAFDCIFYDGKDLRELPYAVRLSYLVKLIDKINYEPFHLVRFMNDAHTIGEMQNATLIESTSDWQECMENAVNAGFEGIVIKSLLKKYYDKGAILKCKKFETIDCVVIGFQDGRGKYENSIGALEIGYYDKAKNDFVKISNVNCGTDAEREAINNCKLKYLYKVVEVKCQEITDKSLRHPVFVRFRDDKDYTMCTKDTIFKEVE